MGQSNVLGAVTKLYKNDNGSFVDTNTSFKKLYDGDINWVDLNKDGNIDLVASGYNQVPETRVYINNGKFFINKSSAYGLPALFSSKMAWGDLDNDGDIDLAFSGIDKDDNYVFDIYYREDGKENFIKESAFSFQGFVNGDLKIADFDSDGDNDIIYSGENSSGNPVGGIIYNSYIKSTNSNNWNSGSVNLKKSSIELAYFKDFGGMGYVVIGEDGSESLKTNTTFHTAYSKA